MGNFCGALSLRELFCSITMISAILRILVDSVKKEKYLAFFLEPINPVMQRKEVRVDIQLVSLFVPWKCQALQRDGRKTRDDSRSSL